MADNPNLLSTPENYATPAQIKSTYDYAKALLYGPQQQSVHHWTQGVSNMVNALVGGNLDYQANQRELAARDYLAKNKVDALKGTGAFEEGPSSGGQSNNAGEPLSKTRSTTSLYEGSGDPLSKAMSITSSQESGGNYGELGPVVARRNGRQDRAYGKYQIMGENIPVWTQEALGQSLTPAQFLASPEAQDATYRHKMSQYIAQYGPEGAARAWLGGPGGVNHPERRDSLGTSVGDYGHRFAMAFNGTPSAPDNSGVQAITSALRGEGSNAGGTQVAAARGGAAGPGIAPPNFPNVSAQPQGGPYINPSLIKPHTNFTPQNLRAILGSPWQSEEGGNAAFAAAIQQGQPISVPYMGGAVLIDPRNPQNQQFMPNVEWKTRKIGDIEVPFAVIPNGRGGFIEAPVAPMPGQGGGAGGPRSEATPSAAPASAPQGGSAPGASPIQAQAQNAPEPAATAPSKPVQVASLEPNAGVQEPKPTGAASVTAIPDPTATAAAGADTPLAKFAQAGPPPLIDQRTWDTYVGKKNFDTNVAAQQEMNKQEIEHGMKAYDAFRDQAAAARNLMPNVDTALALMNDPRMHTGMLAGAQDVWSRFKAAVLGEKDANAPNELFDKLAAGNVLGTMKSTLQGLGQVRLAEINLLAKANASRFYGDPANRAVLEISKRGLEKIDQLDGMAKQYVLGDDVVDPITGKVLLPAGQGKRHGLDAGFDKVAREYVNEVNKKDEAEYKNFEQLFNTGRDPSGAQLYELPEKEGELPKNPQVGQIVTVESKKTGPTQAQWNGTKWVPLNQQPAAPVSK